MPRPTHRGRHSHESDTASDSEPDSDSHSPTIPLEKQTVFGAGLKRKRITFVPAGAAQSSSESQTRPASGSLTPAQRYWEVVSGTQGKPQATQTQERESRQQGTPYAREDRRASGSSARSGSGIALVSESRSRPDSPLRDAEAEHETQYLGQEAEDSPSEWTTEDEHEHEHDHKNPSKENADEICPICHLRLQLTTHPPTSSTSTAHPQHTYTHESLLAHQVSLPHIHPPSALDRRRIGVRYLAAWGWDVDSRTGLGKEGTGRRDIVRVVNKQDTLGLGVDVGKGGRKVVAAKKKLNARQMRAVAVKGRKRAEELHARVFGREDELQKILNA